MITGSKEHQRTGRGRTLIAARSWLRTMMMDRIPKQWLEEHQQGTLIAASATARSVAMDEDDDEGQNSQKWLRRAFQDE
uniref:Uncharacterized protein n=1 Tax=Arundo donax TaxID=35708 RepID=A0A0A9AVB7_ARUDO